MHDCSGCPTPGVIFTIFSSYFIYFSVFVVTRNALAFVLHTGYNVVGLPRSLKALTMHDMERLSDSGMVALCGRLPYLGHLHLSNCVRISDDGIFGLVQANGNNNNNHNNDNHNHNKVSNAGTTE
jgi:hypothetical protein